MRRRLAGCAAAAVLCLALPAAAEVIVAPAWTVTVIDHDLTTPSGAAADGPDLVLTDLADGRVVRRSADGATSAVYEGLPFGRDVLGAPTGPYKVQVHDGGIVVGRIRVRRNDVHD